jgi:hypothetical protein
VVDAMASRRLLSPTDPQNLPIAAVQLGLVHGSGYRSPCLNTVMPPLVKAPSANNRRERPMSILNCAAD